MNKKLFKKLIEFILIIVISFSTFAMPTHEEDKELYRDAELATRIATGFYGMQSNDYTEFVRDINAVSTETYKGNVVYVYKNREAKNLILGHSIVAFGGNSIKDQNIDVVGLTGARIYYIEKILDLMPTRKYKNIVIWLGINDVLYYQQKGKTLDEIFLTVTSEFDEFGEKLKDLNAKVYFMTISPTGTGEMDQMIHKINQFLVAKFNVIDAKYKPDLNEHHFYTTTFRQIYDEQIKPVIIGD